VNEDRRSPSLIAHRTMCEQELGSKQNGAHAEQPECVAGHGTGRGLTPQATDQDAGRQEAVLREAGALVAPSNAAAARLALRAVAA